MKRSHSYTELHMLVFYCQYVRIHNIFYITLYSMLQTVSSYTYFSSYFSSLHFLRWDSSLTAPRLLGSTCPLSLLSGGAGGRRDLPPLLSARGRHDHRLHGALNFQLSQKYKFYLSSISLYHLFKIHLSLCFVSYSILLCY